MTRKKTGVSCRRSWHRAVPLVLALALGAVLSLPMAGQALQMLPDGAEVLSRIKILREGGRLEEALDLVTAALRTEPGRRELHLEQGLLLGALQRYEEALAEFAAILAENPSDLEALLEHAQVKTLQQKYDEAEGEFRFILALSPGLPGAAFGLGDVLTAKGDLAGARAAYLDFVRARPDDPCIHARLGTVALLAGDAAEAGVRFREALRLDPANAEARAGLAQAGRLAASEHRFRFELGYTHETLTSGQPDWRGGATSLRFRPWAGTEFYVGGQAVHRFGENDQSVFLGFSQELFRYFTLSGNFSQGLTGRLLPEQAYDGQLAVLAAPWLQVFASYNFSDFEGNVTASTVSPGVQVRLPWRLSLLGRYYRTESTGNEASNAFLVQLDHETTERFQPYVGYSRGGLAAGALTSEELRNANSQFQSVFAGFSLRILSRFGIKVDWAYQTVKNLYRKNTFGLATFFEF